MAESTMKLPLELLIQLIDVLIVQQDPFSLKAASNLAATCRALRNSDRGKRARYVRLLALRSMTIPAKLPLYSAYELETLGTSRWPHDEPDVPQEGTAGQIDGLGHDLKGHSDAPEAEDAFLVGGEQVILSKGTNAKLHYSTLSPHKSASTESSDLPLSGYSKSILESGVERKSITTSADGRDRERTLQVTMDVANGRYAVLCSDVEEVADGEARVKPETIEIRCLESGELALPGEQAMLRFETSNGDADRNGSIKKFELVGDFLLVQPSSGQGDVRRWRPAQPDGSSHFPIIWTVSLEEKSALISITLLAPSFVAVQTAADTDTFEYIQDPAVTFLRMYQLDATSSHHVATFGIPDYGTDADPVNYVACGASIDWLQEGLVVIASRAHVWLLRLNTLAFVLWWDAPERASEELWSDGYGENESDEEEDENPDEEKVREVTYSVAWTRANMLRITDSCDDTHAHVQASVSGWRCAFTYRVRDEPFWKQLPPKMRFIDASPVSCLDCEANDPPDHECDEWPGGMLHKATRYPICYEHELGSYLPPAACGFGYKNRKFRLTLEGGRLMLFCLPKKASPSDEQPEAFLRIWRV